MIEAAQFLTSDQRFGLLMAALAALAWFFRRKVGQIDKMRENRLEAIERELDETRKLNRDRDDEWNRRFDQVNKALLAMASRR